MLFQQCEFMLRGKTNSSLHFLPVGMFYMNMCIKWQCWFCSIVQKFVLSALTLMVGIIFQLKTKTQSNLLTRIQFNNTLLPLLCKKSQISWTSYVDFKRKDKSSHYTSF